MTPSLPTVFKRPQEELMLAHALHPDTEPLPSWSWARRRPLPSLHSLPAADAQASVRLQSGQTSCC